MIESKISDYFKDGFNGHVSDKTWEAHGYKKIIDESPPFESQIQFLGKPLAPYGGHRFTFEGVLISQDTVSCYGSFKALSDFDYWIQKEI